MLSVQICRHSPTSQQLTALQPSQPCFNDKSRADDTSRAPARAVRAREAALERDRWRAAHWRAMARAPRVIQASHERLIITYSVLDNTVYLLTPPGEDPRAVLRAARLVLPEDVWAELADRLGNPFS